MRDDTIDDWQTRLRVAHREGAESLGQFKMIGWVVGLGVSAIMCGGAWLGVPLAWLFAFGVGLTVLSIASLLLAALEANTTRGSYIEMTLSHVEAEIERLHARLDGIEFALRERPKRYE